jgi:hypothetical protein
VNKHGWIMQELIIMCLWSVYAHKKRPVALQLHQVSHKLAGAKHNQTYFDGT